MLERHSSTPFLSLQYKNRPIRTLLDAQGQPWWVAADVCAVLELSDVSKACKRLDADEKGTKTFPTLGGSQELLIINEPGLYKLILRSTKTEAKAFQRWVTHEVLPQLRQTGTYTLSDAPQPPTVVDPDLQAIVALAQYSQETRAIAQRADAKADVALGALGWMTIRQYVYKYALAVALPPRLATVYGRYLNRHCYAKGIPIYDKESPLYGREHEYPEQVIRSTLPRWLARRAAQLDNF